MPIAIIVILILPFAISGYRRAWRGPLAVWIVLALYAGYVWTLPIPADLQESDRIGAAAWQIILLILAIGSAAALAVGLAVSAVRSERHPNQAKEAVE